MISAEGGVCAGDNKTLKYDDCDGQSIIWELIVKGQVLQTATTNGEFNFVIPDSPYQVHAKCCAPE